MVCIPLNMFCTQFKFVIFKEKYIDMEGIKYLVDATNKKVAVQIDLDKYGALIEDMLDIIEAEDHKDEETITLEELKAELKKEGKL